MKLKLELDSNEDFDTLIIKFTKSNKLVAEVKDYIGDTSNSKAIDISKQPVAKDKVGIVEKEDESFMRSW